MRQAFRKLNMGLVGEWVCGLVCTNTRKIPPILDGRSLTCKDPRGVPDAEQRVLGASRGDAVTGFRRIPVYVQSATSGRIL